MNYRLLKAAMWVLLLALWPVFIPDASATGEKDTDPLAGVEYFREKFKAGKFDELEKDIKGLHAQSRDSEKARFYLKGLAYGIASGAPEDEALYSRWIALHPDSAIAYWARCLYYNRIASYLRGNDVRLYTNQTNISNTEEFMALAMEDCRKAVDLDPSFSLAYPEIMSFAMYKNRDSLKKEVGGKALHSAYDPSHIIPSFFFSLLRRWGGAPETVRQAVQAFRPYLEARDDLRPYLGFEIFYKAMAAGLNKEREAALNNFTKLIDEHGGTALYHYWRGREYMKADAYDKAYTDFAAATRYDPFFLEAYEQIALIWNRTGNYEDAADSMSKALLLEPYDSENLTFRANIYTDYLERPDLAQQDYDRSVIYGLYNDSTRYRRGRFYLYVAEDPEAALEDLAIAYELRSDKADYAFSYAMALFKLDNCEARTVFDSYLSLCRTQPCGSEAVSWVKELFPALRNTCPL